MYRFKRDYELKIHLETQLHTIKPDPKTGDGLRITFDGAKKISGDPNACNIEIYNLNPDKRKAVIKDKEDRKTLIPIELSVGYQGSLLLLFKGNAESAGTRRSGTDYITKIECLDGGHAYRNSHTSITVTKRKDAIKKLIDDMNRNGNITYGYVPELEEFQRPVVMSGDTFRVIEQLLNKGDSYFIDNEQFYIIRDGETLEMTVPIISAETGLIDTPEKKEKSVTFKTVINPEIKLGGCVSLKSATAEHLNGTYKVLSMNFKGDYMGADWTQSVECKKV
ncbi:MAG: hypothetical protein LBH05_01550 [Deferribacteraceae bacterium]|nr:hypothetical protein [Deferribacteraceae bacterium]